MSRLFVFLSCAIFLFSCKEARKVDLILYNAVVYTVNDSFSVDEAIAIHKGKIVAVGGTDEIKESFEARELLDLGGLYLYPGFIDAHAHFLAYGMGLQRLDVTGSRSWQEVLAKAKTFGDEHPDGWLLGRGWDQNLWDNKSYPDKKELDKLFPDRPVLLTRVDGHAALANQKALEIAEIHAGDTLTGGEILAESGQLSGLLIDEAVSLVRRKIPPPSDKQTATALLQAQENCFAAGLTTVDDCGLDVEEMLFIDSLQKEGLLKMRLYIMLNDAPANYDYIFSKGNVTSDRLNVRSFKIYADGALGSRGACLLQPYTDRPGYYGFLIHPRSHFDSVAKLLFDKGFQMCTHAIGDSANRIILRTYARYLKPDNDLRWRIEHAQVVNEHDVHLFGKHHVIPSVQPTHATSDMYWAETRLGSERMKIAYAFQTLLKENGWLPLGTDFPIEDISPLGTFCAAVFRTDSTGFPPGGFQSEEALSREQALRGMTIWAAKANFEEGKKGSIEIGKYADLVLLDVDLMQASAKQIREAQVLATWINGEKVFGRKVDSVLSTPED